MIKFIEIIWNEMGRGNFSFLILLVGVAQLVVMCRNKHYNKRHFQQHIQYIKGETNDLDRLG